MVRRDPYRISNAEALTAKCPRCGQEPGRPCVHVRPKGGRDDYDPTRWSQMRQQMERVGTPAKSAHLERRTVVRARWQRVPRPVEQPEQSEQADPDLLAVSQAVWEWDKQEFRSLRHWLLRYGYILDRPTPRRADERRPD